MVTGDAVQVVLVPGQAAGGHPLGSHFLQEAFSIENKVAERLGVFCFVWFFFLKQGVVFLCLSAYCFSAFSARSI